jgi:hypothetical protein
MEPDYPQLEFYLLAYLTYLVRVRWRCGGLSVRG